MTKLLSKVFGTRNERLVRRMGKTVQQINAFEPELQQLSDDALRAKTAEFKQRLTAGETLDTLLAEAFAVVREASVRSLKMRHFDVQLIGGMVLHSGKIAEMRTGEGKTLVATLAAYLNALTGKGVHVVTVNDYLAKRDAEWMGPLYDFLGLTVGVNLTTMNHDEKQAAYLADITYGTNNEFGFDYLRDNMAFRLEDRVQRDRHFAIVDEVDSILIDEARTPLIISGPTDESSDLYHKINIIIPKLTRQEQEEGPGDYSLDEKTKQAFFTEAGHERVEELLIEVGLLSPNESLYDPKNISVVHHLNAGLRAHTLFQRDVDYIVKDDKVVIVDEHTGRLMDGRRWSDGLHQAVEAKEGVTINRENQTLASITFQNYFRLYDKLAGMTGTADTEAFEFQQIYGLEVVVIPTNRPIIRKDMADMVFLTQRGKYKAIIENIIERREKGQPILVGTASIEANELLSSLLKQKNIPHEILNAKQHEREAKIIVEAGRPGSVTIATNMAGRGTDIVLGGNLKSEIAELENPSEEKIAQLTQDWKQRHEKVINAGGLHVLGSERNESRRIDNQLRGRSGRQGDPGSSQYFLSLEDNLMRIFATEKVGNLMRRLGMTEDEAIENPMVSRAIENAQRKVEGHNFDIRKQLLQYDDVANDQRKVVYLQRDELMQADDISDSIAAIRDDVMTGIVDEYVPPQSLEEQWDVSGLEQRLKQDFGLSLPLQQWLEEDEALHEETLRENILNYARAHYQEKFATIDPQALHNFEKSVMLQQLDNHWKEHLAAMDHLRQGIHLRGYAQKNPAQEFKRESFNMFTSMLGNIKNSVISTLMTVEIQQESEAEAIEQARREEAQQQMNFIHQGMQSSLAHEAQQHPDVEQEQVQTFVRDQPKVGRNQPCPCGSGKKFKHCHGQV